MQKRLFFTYYVCSILCLIRCVSVNAQQIPEINQTAFYTTPNKNTTISEILTAWDRGKFKQLAPSILNAGIPHQYYWLQFSISNPANQADSLIIEIDNSRLNQVELFEVCNDQVRSLGRMGDFYPFKQRNFLHKSFIYRTALPPDRKKNYFLFADQIGHACIIPLKLYTAKNFNSFTFRDYLFDGVTYGILLFVSVLSLLFFLTSRYYLYLYYSLYIKTALVWFMSYFGLGYQYLWGSYPFMNTLMAPCMASLNILLNMQICQFLLKLKKSSKLLNNLVNSIKAVLLATAFFPVFINLNKYGYTVNHLYLVIFLCTILLAMLLVSVLVIRFALKGSLEAKVYLIASLVKAGGIINLALLELGLSPAISHMEGLLQGGIFVEIALLTYALANRYSIFKVKTFEKVIEAHEKERALISKEIHDSISNSLTGINYGIADITRNIDYLPEQKLKLKKILDELGKLQVEARHISHNTMPDYIKKNSIADIVEKWITDTRGKTNCREQRSGVQINFSANQQLINFSEAVKLNIFRIVQELVTNILRHSRATQADLLLSFGKRELTIIAEDNGVGFTPRDGDGGGMGIKNIRSRVELLDGNLSIQSPLHKRSENNGTAEAENGTTANGHGTLIEITIPYRNNSLNNKNGYDY
ncbi:MAG: hypothetical protein INR73_04180 [Williamsia sp.]|nr:hypothetical protein [Williamsia sp.]